jgi:hypothetical protein
MDVTLNHQFYILEAIPRPSFFISMLLQSEWKNYV